MLLKTSAYKNNKIEAMYKKTLDEVAGFLGVEGFKPPTLILLEDRKAIDIIRGKETPDWVVGWYADRIIFLLCPENYSQESKHTYSDAEYERLIKHEVGHFFYKALVGSYKPIWLSEGLSVYLSEQYKEREQPETFKSFLKNYSSADETIYTESGYAVKLLIDKYGKEKLVEFIKGLWEHKTPQDVEIKFQEIYGKPLSFDTFNSM